MNSKANPALRSGAQRSPTLLLLLTPILAAMAGGMGWGIRGQYGHETGAMIAGVLVGFVLVLFYLVDWPSLKAARIVALFAVGISFGGSMTYGQTVGLTHDAPLVGNWEALRWGLLGLAIKGGLWIGFGGAFLGMAMSGKSYRPLDMAVLMPTLIALFVLGVWLINQPFDPRNEILPTIYFSDDWHWEPGADLRPRPEVWGGFLLALAGLTLYLYAARRDWLGGNMACIGFIAGGLGFPLGQSVQAFHAWNPEFFQSGMFESIAPYINWWNMMEITFGTVFGFVLAVGLWLNRGLIALDDAAEEVTIDRTWELVLFAGYVFVLVAAEFLDLFVAEMIGEFGIVMAVASAVFITGGRYWPYLFALPVVAVPIAGKTLRQMSYETTDVAVNDGWLWFVAGPIALSILVAWWLAWRGMKGQPSARFAGIGLFFTTWLYFWLNFAFFRMPWPWEEWTGRTPSGIIFSVCAICLTLAALAFGWSRRRSA